MNTLADRRFQHMLGLSVVLHGALFMALPRPPLTPPAMPTLLASIRLALPEVSAPSPASQPASAQVPQRPEQAAQSPAQALQRSATPSRPEKLERLERANARPVLAVPQAGRPSVRQPSAASPVALSEPAVQPTAQPAAQAVLPVEVAAATPAPKASDASPATTPRPAAPRPSTEALDSYRRQLTDLFARAHEYPRVAALRGWEGEVRLRVRVARRGQLLGVRVDRSSGFEVLDQDALALLEGHGSLPPLPDALEVAEIEVVVPITYRLRKAT